MCSCSDRVVRSCYCGVCCATSQSDGTPWRRRETKKQTAFIASLLKRRSNYMLSVGAAEALLWAHWHLRVRGAKMRNVRPGSQSDARGHGRHAANSWPGVLWRPAGPLQSIRWEFNFRNRPNIVRNIAIIYSKPKTLQFTSCWREANLIISQQKQATRFSSSICVRTNVAKLN